MEPEEAGQRARRLLALHVWIVLARFQQPEVRRIRCIALEHIEDEALLDRLSHRVPMCRFAVAPEHRERLVLRCGRESEEAQVCLLAALGHAAEQLLEIFTSFVGCPLLSLLAE